jgi:hypothetical protein
METISKRPPLISWVLFFICISFPYLLLASSLGFYFDDWNYIGTLWGFHSSKPLHDLCSFDRPYLYYIYNTLGRIIGKTPLAWHLLIYGSLLVAGYLIYRTIRSLKYFDAGVSLAIAGIIILYPCNLMYYSAVTYSFPFTFPLIFFIASLWLTIGTYKNKSVQIAAFILSAALTFLHEIQTEYLVGLELSRLFIIYAFLMMKEGPTNALFDFNTLKKSFFRNLTNYGVTFMYIIWRFFIFHTERKETNQDTIMKDILGHPVKALTERTPKMISDLFTGFLGSFFNVFSGASFLLRSKAGFFTILILSICIILIVVFRKSFLRSTGDEKFRFGTRQFHAMIIGVFILVSMIALLPVWFIDKHIDLNGANSRFGFPMAIPGGFVLAFVLLILFPNNSLKHTLWIYLALCSAFFYRTFLDEARIWKNQRMFYSQILWRYPKLPEGTAFITNKVSETSHSHIEAPLNFMYGYSQNPNKMNFWIYEMGNKNFCQDSITQKGYFSSNLYSQKFLSVKEKEIALTYEEGKCLKFGTNNGPFQNGVTDDLKSFIQGANLNGPELPDTTGNPGKWPKEIMGKPVSTNCYCYYFQKASYYNSLKNYEATAKLFDELTRKKQKFELPNALPEWIPFVKALLITRGLDNTLLQFKNLLSPYQLNTISNTRELIVAK